jgi:hypothetical protein
MFTFRISFYNKGTHKESSLLSSCGLEELLFGNNTWYMSLVGKFCGKHLFFAEKSLHKNKTLTGKNPGFHIAPLFDRKSK